MTRAPVLVGRRRTRRRRRAAVRGSLALLAAATLAAGIAGAYLADRVLALADEHAGIYDAHRSER